MKYRDLENIADVMGQLIGEKMLAVAKPLLEEIANLKTEVAALKALQPLKGDPGKDADPEVVKRLVLDSIVLPQPIPIDVKEITSQVLSEVSANIESFSSKFISVDDFNSGLELRDARLKAIEEAPGHSEPLAELGANIQAFEDKVQSMILKHESSVEERLLQQDESIDQKLASVKTTIDELPLITEDFVVGSVAKSVDALSSETNQNFNKVNEEIAKLIGAQFEFSAVEDLVTRSIAALPEPKPGEPGKSVLLTDVLPPIEDFIKKQVSEIELPVAAQGVGVVSVMISQEGNLLVTLSNGEVKDAGRVVGKDVDMDQVNKKILSEVAKIPKPKDGNDGIGFDNLEIVSDGERSFTLRAKCGDKEKSSTVTVPWPLYKGIFVDGEKYVKGDTVTWGGSLWYCNADELSGRPEISPHWKLMVKRGRDAERKPVKKS